LLGCAAFGGARSALVAQFLLIGILGAVTIAGLNWVQKREAQTPIADWMR